MANDETPEEKNGSDGEVVIFGQALLFSAELEKAREEEESRGIYTLERVRAQRPGLVEAVIAGTAAGEGQLSMAKKLNCHHRTISAIQRHPDFAESIDIARSKQAVRLGSAASKLVELIDNDPHSVPANVRALAAVQLIQARELLDGRATHRTEEIRRVELHDPEEWRREIRSHLPPAEKELHGVRIIGSDAWKIRAIEAAAPSSVSDATGARIDAESEVSEPITEVSDRSVTTDDTTSATNPAPDPTAAAQPADRRQGAGGMLAHDGGLSEPMDPNTQKFSGNGSPSSNP